MGKRQKKRQKFWNKHGNLIYLLLFLIAFFVFFYLQTAPGFADPDSFYHAKMASLIKEDAGAIRQFPWLRFTILKDNFADHHFLYHLLLIPFIIFFSPLVGTKLAAIVFASLAIVIIYWFLRSFRVKGALFYALFLLVLQPFVFRISLAKAPVLSIIFLLFALYCLHKRKKWQLFLLSFFYVWLYGGWPLIIVFSAIFLFVEASVQAVRRSWHHKLLKVFKCVYLPKERYKEFFSPPRLKLFFIVFGGVLAGLFVNPFFPKNLKFYWYQTFKIAVVNYQKIIGVGAEWYPYFFNNFVHDTFFVLLLTTIALVLFLISINKQSKLSWSFFVFTIIFSILTLKSRRNVEYLVPFMVIFSAFSIDSFLKTYAKQIRESFKLGKKYLTVLKYAGLILFLGFWLLLARIELPLAKKALSDGYQYSYLQQASQFLHQNSQPGDLVFHSDWDEFPSLFYHNSKNYYIMGLDPTFMYEYDKERYWEYVDVTLGRRSEDIYDIIKRRFGAKFVLAAQDHQELINNLSTNFYFIRVYEDEEAVVFEVL